MAEMLDYILLIFVWLVSTIAIRFILTIKKNKNDLSTLPSPLALPIIGHFHLIYKVPHKSFHNLSIQYGPLVHILLGSMPCLVISNPEIAKEFLKTDDTFSNRFVNFANYYLTYGSKDFLFAPYGDHWKFMKKICISKLLNGRIIDQFLPLRQQETLRFLRHLRMKGDANEAVDVASELLVLTNRIITRMAMSKTCVENDSDVEHIRKIVQETVELMGEFHLSDYIWFLKNWNMLRVNKRLKESLARFDTLMEGLIREHQEEKKKRKENGEGDRAKDLLDILLEIYEDDENNEMKLSIENIKAFILDIFIAGTDTSAVTTEWALAELINNPDMMEKARQEIDSITENKRLIQESDIPNLPYLQAIFKETLRIHPAIPFYMRQSSKSCNVYGFHIPANSLLLINLWSMGRNSALWNDPHVFHPERFLSDNNNLYVKGQDFQFMPFGIGRRVCPGSSLAFQVTLTNLASMIQCFEWKVSGNGKVNMEEKASVTLRRVHPLMCVPFPRFNCF